MKEENIYPDRFPWVRHVCDHCGGILSNCSVCNGAGKTKPERMTVEEKLNYLLNWIWYKS